MMVVVMIKTNADLIRSMSDEELADFLADREMFNACNNCDFNICNDCNTPSNFICTKGYAAALIHEWLQSGVE